MPLIHLITNVAVAPETRESLGARLSQLAAAAIGKPESYMMAVVQDGAVRHGGAAGPAAFVDVRSISGLGPKVCSALSQEVCALLGEVLRVPGERIYLNFTDVPAGRWGHHGGTFG